MKNYINKINLFNSIMIKNFIKYKLYILLIIILIIIVILYKYNNYSFLNINVEGFYDTTTLNKETTDLSKLNDKLNELTKNKKDNENEINKLKKDNAVLESEKYHLLNTLNDARLTRDKLLPENNVSHNTNNNVMNTTTTQGNTTTTQGNTTTTQDDNDIKMDNINQEDEDIVIEGFNNNTYEKYMYV